MKRKTPATVLLGAIMLVATLSYGAITANTAGTVDAGIYETELADLSYYDLLAPDLAPAGQ